MITILQPVSPCDFGASPVIDVPQSPHFFGYYLVNPAATIITASLPINVDDVSLLYVATSEGIEVVSQTTVSLTPLIIISTLHMQYEVPDANNFNRPTGEKVDTITSGGSSVKDISWEDGSDYITVTTKIEVGLLDSI